MAEDNKGETPEELERIEAEKAQAEEARLQSLRYTAGAKKIEDEWRYSESHVKKIHAENAARRKRESELDAKVKEHEATLKKYADKELEAETDLKKKLEAVQKREKDNEQQLNEKLTAADRRYILSEAKRAATLAGMHDVDDVSNIDLADLRIGDDGSVDGLDEKIAALKTAKPHWFKAPGDQAEPKKKPVVTPGRKDGGTDKDWKSASAAEVDAELRRRGVMA